MKVHLQLRLTLIVVITLAFSTLHAQLNGGTIAILGGNSCTNSSTPASEIESISLASGGVAPYTYQWQAKIAVSDWANVVNNAGNNPNLFPGILTQPVTYRRKVVDGSGNISYSNEVLFLISSNFKSGVINFVKNGVVNTTFTIQPGDASPLANGSIAANGSGNYSYSWETSTISSNGPWNIITGENGLTYQPPTYSTPGYRYFRMKVVDNICGNLDYSNPIILNVTTNLTAFNPGKWTHAVPCVVQGSMPAILAGTLPTGGSGVYTYQWEMKPESQSTWQIITGATSFSYQPGIITESTSFRRFSSDGNGNSGYTNEDMVQVAKDYSLLNAGSIAFDSINIAPNTPYRIINNVNYPSNIVGGVGYFFWQKSSDNGNTWNIIDSISSVNYFPPNQPSVYCYRRGYKETCIGGPRDIFTATVCIPATSPLTGGNISIGSSNSACVTPSTTPGIITGTAATGGSAPYTYKWQKFIDPDWTDIAGTNTVSYDPGVINHDIKYRRLVSDASGTTLYSNEVTVTVKSLTSLKGGIIDGPIVTCSNTAPGIINNILDACGGGGTFTYTWEISTNGGSWSLVSGSNQATYNASAINADTKYRRKVADGCGGEVYSNEVSVYVYPTIEAGTITPSTQSVCTNQTPEILGLAQNCHYTNGNVTYQWQKSLSPSGPWTNVNGATNPYLLPKVSTVSSYYRLVVRSSVCNAEAISNVSSVIVNNCTVRTTGGTDAGNLVAANYSGKGNIKVYPNPIAKGQIVFVTFDGEGAGSKATLRGTDGRAYSCTIVAGNRGSLQVKLPNGVAQGTYILQINNGSKQWIERVVVL